MNAKKPHSTAWSQQQHTYLQTQNTNQPPIMTDKEFNTALEFELEMARAAFSAQYKLTEQAESKQSILQFEKDKAMSNMTVLKAQVSNLAKIANHALPMNEIAVVKERLELIIKLTS